jgi:hypothetical protein
MAVLLQRHTKNINTTYSKTFTTLLSTVKTERNHTARNCMNRVRSVAILSYHGSLYCRDDHQIDPRIAPAGVRTIYFYRASRN